MSCTSIDIGPTQVNSRSFANCDPVTFIFQGANKQRLTELHIHIAKSAGTFSAVYDGGVRDDVTGEYVLDLGALGADGILGEDQILVRSYPFTEFEKFTVIAPTNEFVAASLKLDGANLKVVLSKKPLPYKVSVWVIVAAGLSTLLFIAILVFLLAGLARIAISF
jgi:hypothetical protein